jgi:hypothetical protein
MIPSNQLVYFATTSRWNATHRDFTLKSLTNFRLSVPRRRGEKKMFKSRNFTAVIIIGKNSNQRGGEKSGG